MEPMDFDGTVAVITGAASGIGAAVARNIVSLGGSVVLGDVDTDGGGALAAEVDGIFVETDVRDLDANRALAAAALDAHGRIDLVHLNAGIPSGTVFGPEFDESAYRRAMAINLDGVVFGVQATIDTLLAQGSGQIIVSASMAGLTPVPFDPFYGANKSAVVSLVRSLAELYAESGVRINAVCPSFADTGIIADIRQFLIDSSFPILEVDEVIDTFLSIATGSGTGECWYVVPGRTSAPFEFRRVPGPRQQ